jgi:predicted regulator of Ras-like GTPase activity (Roadblock/LC7/MglB family)
MGTRAREQSNINGVYVVTKDGKPMAAYAKRLSAESFARKIGGNVAYLPIQLS